MLLIDDLIVGPGKFLLWVCRQVQEAAEKETEQEAQRLTAELGELHRRLESGDISTDAFDLRETQILDRLERLQQQAADD